MTTITVYIAPERGLIWRATHAAILSGAFYGPLIANHLWLDGIFMLDLIGVFVTILLIAMYIGDEDGRKDGLTRSFANHDDAAEWVRTWKPKAVAK